ncbi:hypothetical protein [Actinacidiphila paucisporea]|uniref:Uncharacterized protein n=1 Tax=Actinacidiphila paucisporea TaxID=310782 RepID=A0A1M7NFE9_9ACTN|nr:hypothetical protein [Actinacidiphila paucisporea]SHN02367.1 hypothetical protein SAMN05216499_118106 [Actinacidiphila paucisporea]
MTTTTNDDNITAWTERLLVEAPDLAPEQARFFVHELYFAAQRAVDKELWEANFVRDE